MMRGHKWLCSTIITSIIFVHLILDFNFIILHFHKIFSITDFHYYRTVNVFLNNHFVDFRAVFGFFFYNQSIKKIFSLNRATHMHSAVYAVVRCLSRWCIVPKQQISLSSC